jgi:hypothetical protein
MPGPPKGFETKLVPPPRRRRLISKHYSINTVSNNKFGEGRHDFRDKPKKCLNRNQRHKIYNSISKQLNNVNTINIVVNLSERKLSLIETNILNKGLNFCFTDNRSTNIDRNIDSDLQKFNRNLQLRYIFNDQSRTNTEKFTGNPNWIPPKGKCSPEINGYTDYLKLEIKKLITVNKTKHNISRKEREALQCLRNDKNILIKKADKGGSIVVLNTVDYTFKMNTMLADPITYTEIPNINLKEAKSQIDEIIDHLFDVDFISKRQKQFLNRCTPKIPILYGLPKIHKNNCPLRPIVSQIDSPAYKLNKYLDYLLTTAEKCIPNLLQDTTRFLQILNTLEPVPENSILFTIDVTSLYTVLPHDLVINYVEEMYSETLCYWNSYTPDIKPIPGLLIKKIIKIILNQTFFTFNNKTYLQNYGITMGAPSSVKLANIALYKHLDKTLKNYSHSLPLLQLRLIDDIFGIWSGSEMELLAWVKFLNDSHQSIKFTLDFSTVEIPFLDTLVYVEHNKVKTKLYKKPTDNKQYLHFNSEHPQHVKKAIPYAQALRYRRIIEDDNIFHFELQKLKSNFINRLFPEHIVDTAILLASNLNRLDTIKYKDKEVREWNFIPFVITYNNAFVSNSNFNIYKLLSESWEKLITTVPILNTLSFPKIVFKKCQTINNMVVSTSFPPPGWSRLPVKPHSLINSGNLNFNFNPNPNLNPNPNYIPNPIPIPSLCEVFYSKPCQKPRCNTCAQINTQTYFKSTVYDKVFNLTENLDCSSENIVYLITCSKCNIQYVGETGNPLRVRMNAHRHCVRSNRDTPIGIHFNSNNHNISDLIIMPIEKLQTNSINDRRSREYYWQLTLGTIFPQGLNNFPTENRQLFKNLNLTSHLDLEIFWTLIGLQESSGSDSES